MKSKALPGYYKPLCKQLAYVLRFGAGFERAAVKAYIQFLNRKIKRRQREERKDGLV